MALPRWMHLYFQFLVYLGALTMLVGTLRGNHTLKDIAELKKSHNILKKTVDNLQDEIGQLSSEVLKLKTSPDYALKVLRERYNYRRDQEEVLYLPDEE